MLNPLNMLLLCRTFNLRGGLTKHWQTKNINGGIQCFFSSRIISWFVPKIIYFHYLKKAFLDQSIKNIFYFILKTEAQVAFSEY